MLIVRACRLMRRRYELACAHEDVRRLGVRIPDGVWFCVPCRRAFLDGLEIVRHVYAHG